MCVCVFANVCVCVGGGAITLTHGHNEAMRI
jgi:hypothetical protein